MHKRLGYEYHRRHRYEADITLSSVTAADIRVRTDIRSNMRNETGRRRCTRVRKSWSYFLDYRTYLLRIGLPKHKRWSTAANQSAYLFPSSLSVLVKSVVICFSYGAFSWTERGPERTKLRYTTETWVSVQHACSGFRWVKFEDVRISVRRLKDCITISNPAGAT